MASFATEPTTTAIVAADTQVADFENHTFSSYLMQLLDEEVEAIQRSHDEEEARKKRAEAEKKEKEAFLKMCVAKGIPEKRALYLYNKGKKAEQNAQFAKSNSFAAKLASSPSTANPEQKPKAKLSRFTISEAVIAYLKGEIDDTTSFFAKGRQYCFSWNLEKNEGNAALYKDCRKAENDGIKIAHKDMLKYIFNTVNESDTPDETLDFLMRKMLQMIVPQPIRVDFNMKSIAFTAEKKLNANAYIKYSDYKKDDFGMFMRINNLLVDQEFNGNIFVEEQWHAKFHCFAVLTACATHQEYEKLEDDSYDYYAQVDYICDCANLGQFLRGKFGN